MSQQQVFEETRRHSIDSLNLEYQEYKHLKTGARHIHLAADDDHNTFMVAYSTLPKDSTGVAHVLEHTALRGSKRYPIRNPHGLMKRRSLCTYMNAMTSSDWTAYPFASRNRKDYFNLLDVYLDAAFFPILSELDFSQEGHRLDFTESGNIDSPLVYKGVVFNEMKGAYSSPNRRLHNQFSKALFPTTTYHYDSGGDPAEILNLRWSDLKSFHTRHYHPSNAIVFTYGDIPVSQIHGELEEKALSHFDRFDVSDLTIPDEKRYTAPLSTTASYPLTEGSIENRTFVVLGWLLGRNSDMHKVMEARVLSGVLLNNSSSPLRLALEASDFGKGLSPISGVGKQRREMTFAAGLKGTNPEHAENIETLILDVLSKVHKDGVSEDAVMTVLHQLELSQRELTSSRAYGLQLSMLALTPALHGADPVATLEIDDLLAQVRDDAGNPQFIPRLIKELLLDNPHRIRLTMTPDPALEKTEQLAESERLKHLNKSLDKPQRDRIAKLAAQLKQRQSSDDNPESLPKVTLADIPEDLKFPIGEHSNVGAMPVCRYRAGTNGIVYQQLVMQMPKLEDELINVLPYYTMCLTQIGRAGRSYIDTQAEAASVLGGLSAGYSTRTMLGDLDSMHTVMMISSKSLNRNINHITRIIEQTVESPDFTELDRIGDLMSQARTASESSIANRGHAFASTAARSRMSASGALSHRLTGLQAIVDLKAIDDRIRQDKKDLQGLADKFLAIHDSICDAPREWLVVSEEEQYQSIEKCIAECGLQPNEQEIEPFEYTADSGTVKHAWSSNVQVNYCAQSHATVPPGHEDAAPLTVLGTYLTNGYLYSAVRENGGAYGVGATHYNQNGSFGFYSYRDPRLQKTYDDFEASIDWMLNETHDKRLLEEAILGTVSQMDMPGSPVSEAIGNYYSERFGQGASYIRKMRKRILSVTLADLKTVADRYLTDDNVHYSVIGPANRLDELEGFEKFSV